MPDLCEPAVSGWGVAASPSPQTPIEGGKGRKSLKTARARLCIALEQSSFMYGTPLIIIVVEQLPNCMEKNSEWPVPVLTLLIFLVQVPGCKQRGFSALV